MNEKIFGLKSLILKLMDIILLMQRLVIHILYIH
ncbi:hypothetical protein vBEcoMWL3_gp230c [Escherichia phage vB_EcoM_WL-3]|nr:hypothetical protein vBEcoMWL3_gp230c [Escherichia phage vB_EcoM_WL-3]